MILRPSHIVNSLISLVNLILIFQGLRFGLKSHYKKALAFHLASFTILIFLFLVNAVFGINIGCGFSGICPPLPPCPIPYLVPISTLLTKTAVVVSCLLAVTFILTFFALPKPLKPKWLILSFKWIYFSVFTLNLHFLLLRILDYTRLTELCPSSLF